MPSYLTDEPSLVGKVVADNIRRRKVERYGVIWLVRRGIPHTVRRHIEIDNARYCCRWTRYLIGVRGPDLNVAENGWLYAQRPPRRTESVLIMTDTKARA